MAFGGMRRNHRWPSADPWLQQAVLFRLEDGKERVVLRKDIERLQATSLSLMAEHLADSRASQDVSDVITWLSRAAE